MIKNIAVKHLKLNLHRSGIVTRDHQTIWDVLNEDKTLRKAIIYKRHTIAMHRNIGYQQFKVQYWVMEVFKHSVVLVGPTRTDILNQLYRLEHPSEYSTTSIKNALVH
jgi:hypothetical protein